MKTIKAKLLALFVATITFATVLTVSVTYQYNSYITDSQQVHQDIGEIQHLSNQLKINFLLQSKSWKNILLRGYNDTYYRYYVSEFQALTNDIDVQVHQLALLTKNYDELNKITQQFGREAADMSARYMEALPVYKLAEHQAHITADKYVRGVNQQQMRPYLH